MGIRQPEYYRNDLERHLYMPLDQAYSQTSEQILDILLDFGFTTCLDLVHFEDKEANLIEFVQDIKEQNAPRTDIKTSSQKDNH